MLFSGSFFSHPLKNTVKNKTKNSNNDTDKIAAPLELNQPNMEVSVPPPMPHFAVNEAMVASEMPLIISVLSSITLLGIRVPQQEL